MTTRLFTPRRASERGRAATTSARPPVLAKGAHSEATWSTRKAALQVSEERRGVLGRGGVDVEARAPLEAGDLREGRHDLDVPVVMVAVAVGDGRRVQHEVVRRVVERDLELAQRRAQRVGQGLEARRVEVL